METVMNKPMLMIPGPVDPPDEVLKRCGGAVFPHYEADFSMFYQKLVEKTRKIFGTQTGRVHIANGSGTTAINMMLASLCTLEEPVLVINNGSFGGYAERNLRNLGIPYTSIIGERGTAIDCDKVRKEMERARYKFIYVTHNESSTAIVNPLPPLGKIAREFDALLLVDSISAVGGIAIDMDESGADVVAGASQKCFELPPGLAPVGVSARAIGYMKKMKNRRVPYVLDLLIWEDAYERMRDWHPQPITGATNLLYALDWMVDNINSEGIKNRQERFRQAGERLKNGLINLGFEPAADPNYASPVVTEFLTPSGITAEEVRNYYMDRHNTMVGRGERTNAAGDVISFRIAHFGLAAEDERVDFMIDITRDFMENK
jgi:aspartate aminotransferase-like enzyme